METPRSDDGSFNKGHMIDCLHTDGIMLVSNISWKILWITAMTGGYFSTSYRILTVYSTRRSSCTLPLQITQTVKPYNQTLPNSNPGRVNGVGPSTLRSVKPLESHKKKQKKKQYSLTTSFMAWSHFNLQKMQNILTSKSQMV